MFLLYEVFAMYESRRHCQNWSSFFIIKCSTTFHRNLSRSFSYLFDNRKTHTQKKKQKQKETWILWVESNIYLALIFCVKSTMMLIDFIAFYLSNDKMGTLYTNKCLKEKSWIKSRPKRCPLSKQSAQVKCVFNY